MMTTSRLSKRGPTTEKQRIPFRRRHSPSPSRCPNYGKRRKIWGQGSEATRRNEMLIDSALGNPNFEQDAADGRLDAPEEEDDK
jgi:hypothetical protein